MAKRGLVLPSAHQNSNPSEMADVIAIMQPTFLPWIGYLSMIDRVDTFVFLDNVQFEKRSWQQRNRIKTANGPIWLTIPVKSKGLQEQKIQDTEISNDDGQVYEKIYKSISHAYAKAPFFSEFGPQIKSIFDKNLNNISDLNIEIILWLCRSIGIKTKMMRASDLSATGSKAELLANICAEMNAHTYISAHGSKEYIDASHDFQDHNIKVFYHTYHHPEYRQLYGEFIPYMSAIDLLFNEGPQALALIRQGLSHD
jgi:hypothetical protein